MSNPFFTIATQVYLANILDSIAREKPNAAIAWIDKIELKCLLIARNPTLGEVQPQLGERVHASVVGRYVIFHREENDLVEILRLIPGDRNIMRL